ncbi:MAG: DNA polymerase domain-containing protein [Candidatus Hadarchaeum sp.]
MKKLARVVGVSAAPPDRIFLSLRHSDGSKSRTEVVGFKPHFYVPGQGGFRSLFGEELRKVIVPDFKLVPQERAKYKKHYQADVPYTRNFLIAAGIRYGVSIPEGCKVGVGEIDPAEPTIKPRRCYADIEVAGEGSLDTIATPAPVVAFSAWDSYSSKYITFVVGKGNDDEAEGFYFLEDERELFRSISFYLNSTDPDVLIGWNVAYDVDYLKNRAAKLGFKIRFPETFDLRSADMKLHRRLSHSLKDVAVEEGFVSEDEVVLAMEALERYGRGDAEFLAEYNRDDVRIMIELDRKYGITEFFEGLKDYAGVVHYDDTLKFSVLVDTMLLRLAREIGVILPSAPETPERQDKYAGALVDFFTGDGSARKGVYENVAVYDFSRYYPSLIRALNISPEVDGPSDEPGIIPRLVERLFEERDKIDAQLESLVPGTREYEAVKRKRDVIKFYVNSLYGYIGAPFTRLHSRQKAEAVTEAGRTGLLFIADFARELGYEPLYGDTDSIMVSVPFEKSAELGRKLNQEIERFFSERYGVRGYSIKMDLNCYAKRILFTGVKKRYAAHVIWQHRPCDYLRVVGFEAIRSDQSKFTQEVQKTLFDLVLRGAREQTVAFVRKALEDFRKQPLERIAFRKGIEMPLEQYGVKKGTGVPSHIRGAIYSNAVFGTSFGMGSKPLYLYVKGIVGKPPTDIVAFERRAPEGCAVDWERMEELTLRGKISDILDAAGITWDEIGGRASNRQRSLADFV